MKKEKDAAILMTLKKHKVYVQSGMYLRGQKWPLLFFFVIFEFLLCDKFVILKLVIVICLRRIIGEKERKI